MKALFTLGIVVDLEPSEIPQFAADMERSGMASLYAGMVDALAGRDLSEEQVKLVRQKLQVFGVSYSVLHELELSSGL